jgi:hypothetical protein
MSGENIIKSSEVWRREVKRNVTSEVYNCGKSSEIKASVKYVCISS